MLLWFELVEIDACIFDRIAAILEEIPFLVAHGAWVQNNAMHSSMPIALLRIENLFSYWSMVNGFVNARVRRQSQETNARLLNHSTPLIIPQKTEGLEGCSLIDEPTD